MVNIDIPTSDRNFGDLPSIKFFEEKGKLAHKQILLEILDFIVPTEEEENKIRSIAQRLLGRLERVLEDLNINAKPELEGSVAKGTWLSGDVDFDVFLLFDPENVPTDYKAFFKEGLLKIARTLGVQYQQRYAEHPYLRIVFEGIEADIVPAFDVDPKNIVSAVDRTPHHTRYVRDKLNPKLANEVRLLKAFLKGINTYGAEIRVGGFSGYACELLILHFESFAAVMDYISRKKKFFIDPTKTWRLKEAKKKFQNANFILIDPVDPKRNVVSPLRDTTLYRTQLLAKLFLALPSIDYFYLPKEKGEVRVVEHESENRDIRSILSGRNILLVVIHKNLGVPPDVYWGQTLRILEGIRKLFSGRREFELLIADIIEGEDMILILEFDAINKEYYWRLKGPPTYADLDNIIKFVGMHMGESEAGPWVEEDRIYMLVKRKTSVVDLLDQYLGSLKMTPSFTEYELLSEPEEIEKFIISRGMLNEFIDKVNRRGILRYITKLFNLQHKT